MNYSNKSVPTGWHIFKLGDCIKDMRGGASLKPSNFTDKGFPILHKGTIRQGGKLVFDRSGKSHTSPEYAASKPQSIVNSDYVVVTLRDLVPTGPTIGTVANLIGNQEFLLAQGAYGLHLNKEVLDRNFLVHLSNSPLYRAAVKRIMVGSTQVHIRSTDFKEMKIPLPPLSEQKRIADILDKADAIRRKRQEAIDSLGELKQATLYDIILNSTDRESWQEKKLGKIAEVKGGIALSSRRNELEQKVPYLRVANVYREQLNLKEIKIIGLTHNEYERTKLLAGDILVVEGHGNRDEIGRSAIWDGSIEGCVHQNHLIRVRPDNSQVRSVYLSAFINSPLGRRQLFRFGKTTSGLNTISLSNVRDTLILLPPLAMQKHMEEVVRKSHRLLSSLNDSFDNATNFFNSLVQRAFKGEL